MNADVNTTHAKWKTIALWTLRVFLALVFLATGMAKLYGVPQLVEGFAQIGLGQWFRYFTGCLEIVGAIAALVPRASAFGGVILLGVSIGAFFTQLFIMHGDVVHTIVLATLTGVLVWTQRDKIVAIFSRQSAASA